LDYDHSYVLNAVVVLATAWLIFKLDFCMLSPKPKFTLYCMP